MKKINTLFVATAAILLSACLGGQNGGGQTNLNAKSFSDKLNELPDAPIIDVRTPGEFVGGHIKNAKNIDWNSADFEAGIAAYDKAKPVFVYCLSGGRSSSAASRMRSQGFTTVYELNGGLMKWRAAGLPETTDNAITSQGMSRAEFDGITNCEKMVLVDFYAEWCAPCKKMKPYLDEISKDMQATVTVVRIDADANPGLMKDLGIDELPVLQLFKKGKLNWTNKGYIDKEGVMTKLQP